MLNELLTSLGFHKNEIIVYTTLHSLGQVRAGEIITQSGLHRNLVYQSLESLAAKGLVAKVMAGNVATFLANKPEMILEMARAQVDKAQQAVEELKKISVAGKREVMVFEGDEGIKMSRSVALRSDPGETLYVIGSKASSTPEMEKYWRRFHQQRESRGIGLKIMYEQGVDPADIEWRNRLPLSQAKYLPFDIDFPVWFAFISDYLEIGVPGNPALTFGLRSQEATGAFRKFFQVFWEQSVVVETGLGALKKMIDQMLESLAAGEEYCVFGASAGEHPSGVQEMYDDFHRKRVEKGVITKMLVYRQSYDRISRRFAECGDPEGKISQLRIFSSAPPIPMQINLYQHKTFFILYSDPPIVIRFSQPEVASALQTYFDELWTREKP